MIAAQKLHYKNDDETDYDRVLLIKVMIKIVIKITIIMMTVIRKMIITKKKIYGSGVDNDGNDIHIMIIWIYVQNNSNEDNDIDINDINNSNESNKHR